MRRKSWATESDQQEETLGDGVRPTKEKVGTAGGGHMKRMISWATESDQQEETLGDGVRPTKNKLGRRSQTNFVKLWAKRA